MSKNNFSLKQAISPVISVILLLSITVIISLGLYQFLTNYVQDTQRTVENNAILDSLQIRSIFTDSDQSIIQTPFEQINISKVIYEGVECTNNSGVVSGKPLRVNMSSCAQASGQSSGTLTIETNEGVIQQNIQIDSFSGSTSGSETEGGSPSFSSCTLDGETVSHGNNGTFYNSSSVAFGNSCSSIVRTCDDGTLDGDSSYNYSSCSVDGQDTDPDAFSFTNQTDVATSSSITSNSLTPTGYDGPLSVSVNGDGSPQISINGGSWTTSTSMSPGDSIEVRLTSSSSYDTTSQATVDLGDYSTTWSVTTEEDLGVDCSSIPGDWIEVPGNSYFGTDNFCVMQFEAKDVSGVATSQPSSTPWVIIDFPTARSACTDLNTEHSSLEGTFKMITNREWMTIARNAEQQSANWADGVVGSEVSSGGGLKRGNVGIDDSASYDGANPADRSIETDTKAMLTLSNGEVIWDVGGNVYEWVDLLENGNTIDGNACSGGGGWYSYFGNDGDSECSFVAPYSKDNATDTRYEMGPLGDYNANEGVGRIYSYDSTGRALLRGGGWGGGADAGAFTAFLDIAPLSEASLIGFRCSYEP
ncbi:MAG: archaellin/type IV pilin N-terminal domain-containing protein [Candidatus Nanoarchaeia archaeon]